MSAKGAKRAGARDGHKYAARLLFQYRVMIKVASGPRPGPFEGSRPRIAKHDGVYRDSTPRLQLLVENG
jgi:hypothetical protein